ncbi:MAG: hypothetical protein JWQ35_811 [Bacteriovoracaceae bacterium]|nr:hypothetical protein [Bacteriovoracaceae bacterium]
MKFFIFLYSFFLLSFSLVAGPIEKFQDRPKLIVVIVFDQFRSDYLTRFEKKFLPAEKKGFQFLMKGGAYFPDAEYDILQCMTGPGHATIMTGSYPYLNGIPLNEWNDGEHRVYCTEDPSEKTLIGTKDIHLGTSPKLMIGTTVGDEIKNAGYSSKSVSIALKDRASILMGGHRADLALWYDNEAKAWTSSSYYLKDLKNPDWVLKLNADLKKNPCDLVKPCAADMTTTASIEALKTFKLGQHDGVDVLTISYSGHDYAGHKYGPNSSEMEDVTLSEDKNLSLLLSEVEKNVPGGLKNVVVVLTADHGIAPTPESLQNSGIESGVIDDAEITKELEERLNKKFGNALNESWITMHYDFNFFLNRKTLKDRKVSATRIEDEIKSYLLSIHGVSYVVTKTEIEQKKLPPGMFERKIEKTYFPGRAGDVIAIFKPFFIEHGAATTHLSGYSYDRTVPIILYGKNIRSGVYARQIDVVDLAPTLSFLVGTIPPSLSEGHLITEAIDLP